MKHQSQISRQTPSYHGETKPAGLQSTHPAIEQAYHADARDLRIATERGKPAAVSPFHHLSREFLARETKRDYLMEAVCFIILVSVSAWPIVAAVRALSLLP
jgi:hypothetical protein